MLASTMSTSSAGKSRRIVVVTTTAIISALLFLALYYNPTDLGPEFHGHYVRKLSNNTSSHRKLMSSERSVDKPDRLWGDKCSEFEIQVNQGPSAPLPSGIPTYTVNIINACASGCDISDIHIKCGSFRSARLIDPLIFKRVAYDDCLVNDGRPLTNGQVISFQYADSRPLSLNVSSLNCL